MSARTKYLLTVGAIAAFLLLAFAARAHDHNSSALTEWMKGLVSQKGDLCCDGKDTDEIEDWNTEGGHYRVKFRGQWFDVPDSAVVAEPNRAGEPLLWMNKGYMGMSVRCFMPGIET